MTEEFADFFSTYTILGISLASWALAVCAAALSYWLARTAIRFVFRKV